MNIFLGMDNAELFRNRKGYFSINVQTVCSVDLKIMDLIARWPGSTHDQTIFDNCNLKRRLENGEFGNSVLVADSGYANTHHVVTPLLRPNNEIEQLYNESGDCLFHTCWVVLTEGNFKYNCLINFLEN